MKRPNLIDGLQDFRRESVALTKAIGKAYNQAIKLKGMWDRFEEIPPKQQQMYDDIMKAMNDLIQAKDHAFQTEMNLRRYR